MSKLPALKPNRLLQALTRAGFYVHHQTGSHVQLRHTTKLHLRVTIFCHRTFDLPAPVVASIVKQANLTREELLELL